jgi:hypothetical protein
VDGTWLPSISSPVLPAMRSVSEVRMLLFPIRVPLCLFQWESRIWPAICRWTSQQPVHFVQYPIVLSDPQSRKISWQMECNWTLRTISGALTSCLTEASVATDYKHFSVVHTIGATWNVWIGWLQCERRNHISGFHTGYRYMCGSDSQFRGRCIPNCRASWKVIEC